MRKFLFQGLLLSPLTEPAPALDEAAVAELASALDKGEPSQARPLPVDP